MATCKDCIHQCYTEELAEVEQTCNFFIERVYQQRGNKLVEFAPVRHGRWTFRKNHGEFVEAECTACNALLLVRWYGKLGEYSYCPHCGARMDLEE